MSRREMAISCLNFAVPPPWQCGVGTTADVALARDAQRLRARRRGDRRFRRSAREDLVRDVDLLLAADVERRALVQLRRLQVENAGVSVGRRAAGLLDDERERVRLVQQAQLAL